jgi:prepilin-type N-terminal cleavage/methylation domain-containing protein
MSKPGFTLVELLIVIVIIGILASLLIPVIVEALYGAREAQCLNNLNQIGKMAAVYMKGDARTQYPHDLGTAWMVRLQTTVCRDVDPELFQCPLEGTDSNLPDYRGPARDVNVARNFGHGDAIGGDKVFGSDTNHGKADHRGVQALTKDGRVLKIKSSDATRWTKYLADTAD